MAAEARGRRRLLPAKERLLVEDAASRVSFSRHTVYYHFRKWRIDSRLRRVDDRLREAVREREGRDRDPSATVIDSQVVKTTPVGGPERGYGGAKRLSGRKRHILVDTGGLILAAQMHGADRNDRDGGRRLLAEDLQG
jgi:putative transposase